MAIDSVYHEGSIVGIDSVEYDRLVGVDRRYKEVLSHSNNLSMELESVKRDEAYSDQLIDKLREHLNEMIADVHAMYKGGKDDAGRISMYVEMRCKIALGEYDG